MKASRLLSILMLLQTHGRLTAAALAEKMEVSERTILRDVDQLSAAGVPLWAERGRQGGFRLREGWTTQLTGLTGPEAQALLLTGLPAAATELGLGAAAASARLKMIASLPGEWREQAARVGERLHVDPLDWFQAEDQPRFLREAADAVWHARRIAVQYQSWRGRGRYELEPLGLVLKAGAWYLVAQQAGTDATRTYRLASLIDLRGTGQGFRRPRRFDLAAAWRDSTERFEAELHRLQARVRLSPRAQAWLLNTRTPVEWQADADASGRPGWREALLPVESIEQGARRLLSWGEEAEVLAPPALREEVRRQALAVLALHPPLRPRTTRPRSRHAKTTPFRRRPGRGPMLSARPRAGPRRSACAGRR